MVAIKIPELGDSTTVYLSNVLILSSLAIISASISALLVAAIEAEKSLVAAGLLLAAGLFLKGIR